MPKLRNFDWRTEAKHLLEIKKNDSWNKEYSSFSAFLKGYAKQQSIQVSSLWRYIKAADFACNSLQIGEWKTVIQPEQIPNKISAESIEVLEKIGRVALPEKYDELAKDLFDLKVRRVDLLAQWREYRKYLPDNATARGRDKAKPKLTLEDRVKFLETEKNALEQFKFIYPSLLGYENDVEVRMYPIFRGWCDAVVAVTDRKFNQLIDCFFLEVRRTKDIDFIQKFVKDHVEDGGWLILLSMPEKLSVKQDIPDSWGVMAFTEGRFKVLKRRGGGSINIPPAVNSLFESLLSGGMHTFG